MEINEQTYDERLNQSLEHTRDKIYKDFPECCVQVMNEVIEITMVIYGN